MNASAVKKELISLANPEKAVILGRFFKTGKGQYGEGDLFLGIKVPDQRKVAQSFRKLELPELKKLLGEPEHECRLTALMILVDRYSGETAELREDIYRFYLDNTKHINNWDLVDLSCDKIVGRHLYSTGTDRSILYELAAGRNLWEQRIAIISTFWFIRNREFTDTLRLCEYFLNHKHDLIHKATGWMLRETGKRNINELRGFLDRYAAVMPRTMLRYSLEKLDGAEKKKYMEAKNKV